MAKLSKKQQVRLGDLINEIQVCIHMIDSGKYDTQHWIGNKYRAIIALHEEFGVEDANLERALEWQEDQDRQERKRVQERRQARQEARKAQAKPQPSDYTAIALWGEELGSYAYYIEAEQTRACLDGAPLNAIFKRDDGTWATLDQMQNLPLKAKLEAQLADALATA